MSSVMKQERTKKAVATKEYTASEKSKIIKETFDWYEKY
jgi:hypothetical protein